MPIEILMPALSPTMTEGHLSTWQKKEGDKIAAGDVIAEIETDKATMEVEAVDEGTLAKIFVPSGSQNVAVNAVIAVLLEEGEDASVLDRYTPSNPVSTSKANAPESSAQSPIAPEASQQPQSIQGASGRVFASPLAKRIAESSGINIAHVQGSGPHGRIIKVDVEAHTKSGSSAPMALHQVGRVVPESSALPMHTMRKVIAKRLLEAKQTIPHYYLNVDCCIDGLLEMRKAVNEAAPKDQEGKPLYKVSVNDFVIKAVALALKAVPSVNASYTDDAMIQYHNVDVSVAVAMENGLITPIIKNADQKTLSQLSMEMKSLAQRAKTGSLAPEEFQGGGFTISNLGMYGIKRFQAIINPPQSAILAIGAGEERVVVKNKEMKIATVMDMTLSADHRIVDGALGAEFLSVVKRHLEAPITMFV